MVDMLFRFVMNTFNVAFLTKKKSSLPKNDGLGFHCTSVQICSNLRNKTKNLKLNILLDALNVRCAYAVRIYGFILVYGFKF